MSIQNWMWLVFGIIITSLLAVDLGFFNKKDRVIGLNESLITTFCYIFIALVFNLFIYYLISPHSAGEFLIGYLIEKSLSLDNVFVISLVFKYFQTPARYQHRVLFWGILGALIMRGVMIVAGAELLQRFHWVIYILSAFLIFTGLKMLWLIDSKPDISKSLMLKFLKRFLRISDKTDSPHFFVSIQNPKTNKTQLCCTVLFITLVMVEFVDLIFAIDSVPAILAITNNVFVIYTSNIFAILGLRALYFAIAAIIRRFIYLNQAISIILIFIGAKIFIVKFMGIEQFPIVISLGVTISVITFGIIYSLYKTK